MTAAQATRLGRTLVLAVMAASAACASGAPPELAVRELPADARGASTRAPFELRNDGGRPLTFDRVVPSCGCAAASRLPTELAPKATARLDVVCAGTGVAGDDVRELALRTNDPRSPETLLRVRLGRATSLAPIYLGYVAVGETLVRDVSVPVTTAAIVPRTAADLDVEAAPAASDGTRAVRLRFHPRAAGVVRTTVDLGPAGLLPITAVAWQGLMAFPPEVRIPRPTGIGGFAPVTLVAPGEAPFEVGRVEYPAGMTGELRAVVPGRQYRLTLAERAPARANDAVIRVHGARADDPVMMIPVVDATRAADAPPPA